MNRKKILVCDDMPDFENSLVDRLGRIDVVSQNFDLEHSGERLVPAIRALEERLKNSRVGNLEDYPQDDASIIDDTSILVIDYNLIELDASITGERAAYLARSYSRCGLIIALNQFPPYVEEHFDLTLKGHPESFADLNIPSDSLVNPGLWSEPWGGFRPWSWPLLPLAQDKFERRVGGLMNHLYDPVLDYLGLLGNRSISLPRSIVGYITKSDNPTKTSFKDFVNDSGNGLRGRGEKPMSHEAVARIAAARINNWLENIVVPSQDILVDAPHLISRYPSLIKGSKNIDDWNRTASFATRKELGLDTVIDEFYFYNDDWLSRPAWFWVEISNCMGIDEVSDPWSVERPDYVFCEDISRFLSHAEARDFIADLESPFVKRYVKYLDGIGYVPRVRFSL